MLVEAISDQFGWYQPADGTPGKVVWAVLQAEPNDEGYRQVMRSRDVRPDGRTLGLIPGVNGCLRANFV